MSARKVFGRVKLAVNISHDPAAPDVKSFIFELRADGLHVRRKHTKCSGEAVLRFAALANFTEKEPRLL